MKGAAPIAMSWMYAAWICWAASLLVLMLSISTAQSGLRSQIRHWDAGDYYNFEHPEGNIGRFTPWLNNLVVGACMLGLVCLVVFALKNLVRNEDAMTKGTGSGATFRTGGQAAPQAPPAAQTGGKQAVMASGDVGKGATAPQVPQAPTPSSASGGGKK
jgi:hypothetical protein